MFRPQEINNDLLQIMWSSKFSHYQCGLGSTVSSLPLPFHFSGGNSGNKVAAAYCISETTEQALFTRVPFYFIFIVGVC